LFPPFVPIYGPILMKFQYVVPDDEGYALTGVDRWTSSPVARLPRSDHYRDPRGLIQNSKKKGHWSGLTHFGPALYRNSEAQYSGLFEFCENKEKLGLGGDLNLGPLSPLSDKFQTIKLGLILYFHINVLFPLLFIVLCIKII
jgi:hypothetical protein